MTKEAKQYLFAQFLFRFGLFFSKIFLVIFLWKGNQSLEQLALFFLIQAIGILLAYYPCSLFARWTSSLLAFRIGVSLYGVCYGGLLYFHQLTDILYLWIALGTGIAESFWSVGTHVITMDLVANNRRDSFAHYDHALTSLSGMIAPFLAGIMITYIGGMNGYLSVFFITTLFFVSSVIYTFLLVKRLPSNDLKSPRFTYLVPYLQTKGQFQGRFAVLKNLIVISKDTSAEKNYRERSNFFDAFTCRSIKWKRLLKASFLWGGAEGLFKQFLLVMVLYFIVKNEWWVGTLTMFSSFLGICASLIYARQIDPQNRHRYYLVAALLLFLFTILLWIFPLFWTLCIVMIVVGITTPALDIPMNTVMYEVIDSIASSEDQRLDFITVREIPLGLGRICSLLFFIYLNRVLSEDKFIYLAIVLFSVMYVMIYWWIDQKKRVSLKIK